MVRKPFHTFNLLQDKIPPVLLRAEAHPYDLSGVDSCEAIADRVGELDLALGPDVDTPKERKSKSRQGATFAASTVADAASTAVTHFIPFDSEIKQVSGAARYERHVQHAILAGETRRAYLKATGMVHNCTWPAAPLAFAPDHPTPPDQKWVR